MLRRKRRKRAREETEEAMLRRNVLRCWGIMDFEWGCGRRVAR